jgi:hypothetical protein
MYKTLGTPEVDIAKHHAPFLLAQIPDQTRSMRAFWLLAFAGAALLAAAGGQQASVPSIITREVFESMLSRRNQTDCEGGFYTYDSFIKAASKFPAFGAVGDEETRRRELAAFFGRTSYVTAGMDDMPTLGYIHIYLHVRALILDVHLVRACRLLLGESAETGERALLRPRPHTADFVRHACLNSISSHLSLGYHEL